MLARLLFSLQLVAACGTAEEKATPKVTPTQLPVDGTSSSTSASTSAGTSSVTSTASHVGTGTATATGVQISPTLTPLDLQGTTWKAFSAPPGGLLLGQAQAAWTGRELIALDLLRPGEESAAAYDPKADTWRAVALPPSYAMLASYYLWANEQALFMWVVTRYSGQTPVFGTEFHVLDIGANTWRSIPTTNGPRAVTREHGAPLGHVLTTADGFYVLPRPYGAETDDFLYLLPTNGDAWQKRAFQNTTPPPAMVSDTFTFDATSGTIYRWGTPLQAATLANAAWTSLTDGPSVAGMNRQIGAAHGAFSRGYDGTINYFDYAARTTATFEYTVGGKEFDSFSALQIACGDFLVYYGGEGYDADALKTSDPARTTLFILDAKNQRAGHVDASSGPAWRNMRGACAGDRLLLWRGTKTYAETPPGSSSFQGVPEDLGFQLMLP